MKFKTETILELIGQLDEILKTMEDKEEQSLDLLESIDPIYQRSAQNLIHYNAFRSFDLSGIQKKLKNMGLTRFANAEGHIIHVGIIMKDNYIIHAHGKVRIDRLDHSGIYNTDRNTHTHKLRVIKKII